MTKGFKKFPFTWRKKWLGLFHENPIAAAVWDYMYWCSDEHNVFDLCEDMMCLQLKINPKTLSKARSTIEKHYGLKRMVHYKAGIRVVRYQMLPFVELPESQETVPGDDKEPKIPENGTQAGYQETVGGLDTEKRVHVVDTIVTGSMNLTPVHETPVDTGVNPVSKLVSQSASSSSLRSSTTAGSELFDPEFDQDTKDWLARLEKRNEPLLRDCGQAIAEGFGLPYISTDQPLTIWGACVMYDTDPNFHRGCIAWAKKHKFWKTRIPTIKSYAKALWQNRNENGLAAQWKSHVATHPCIVCGGPSAHIYPSGTWCAVCLPYTMSEGHKYPDLVTEGV